MISALLTVKVGMEAYEQSLSSQDQLVALILGVEHF